MCGIVGCVGGKSCRQFLLEGLTRLEYRGYDSAGIACVLSDGSLVVKKCAGSVAELAKRVNDLDGVVGIGHTRWATHGAVNDVNAHPHMDNQGTVAIVHNGIIENVEELRSELIKHGVSFKSSTDTEVAACLLGKLLVTHGALNGTAIREFMQKVTGAYSLVVACAGVTDRLILIRRRSPLVVGVGGGDELGSSRAASWFVGSDQAALFGRVKNVMFVPDDAYGVMTAGGVSFFDVDGNLLQVASVPMTVEFDPASRGTYEHFMLKEIYEQPMAIEKTIAGLRELDKGDFWQSTGINAQGVRNLTSLDIVAAGTSWHAGLIARFFFEHLCKVLVRTGVASEYRFEPALDRKNHAALFISQSGETADTLEALRAVKARGVPVWGLANVPSSTITREAQGILLTKAGLEISVASTKAFTAQLAALYFLAHRIAVEKQLISRQMMDQALSELHRAARVMQITLEKYESEVRTKVAPLLAKHKGFIFLGRHVSYPLAKEAALKLKEISYVFAEGHAAGELKHGALAIIEPNLPVLLFSVLDDVLYRKLVGNAHEVKARGAHLTVFAFEGQDELTKIADVVFVLPRVEPDLAPLALTGLMQFLVYRMAVEKGCPIDKPRNLAKSVTVE